MGQGPWDECPGLGPHRTWCKTIIISNYNLQGGVIHRSLVSTRLLPEWVPQLELVHAEASSRELHLSFLHGWVASTWPTPAASCNTLAGSWRQEPELGLEPGPYDVRPSCLCWKLNSNAHPGALQFLTRILFTSTYFFFLSPSHLPFLPSGNQSWLPITFSSSNHPRWAGRG